MSNFRRPIYVILSVVSFLVLAVIASVEYSGNNEKATEVKGQAFYRIAGSVIKMTERIFSTPMAVNTEKAITDTETRAVISEKAAKYIRVEKVEQGWEIIFQNSEKVIWQKTIKLD